MYSYTLCGHLYIYQKNRYSSMAALLYYCCYLVPGIHQVLSVGLQSRSIYIPTPDALFVLPAIDHAPAVAHAPATTLPTEHRSTRAEEMMETGSPPSPHVRVGAMPLARLHSESALGPESQEEDTVSDVASTGAEGSKQHERPETAPAQMKRRLRSAGPPDIAGRQKCRKARGTSARTVESRLDALRVDEALR